MKSNRERVISVIYITSQILIRTTRMKIQKKYFIITMVIVLIFMLSGCSEEDDDTTGYSTDSTSYVDESETYTEAEIETSGPISQGTQLNMTAVTPISMELEYYDGSFFSMQIPKGWTIDYTGEYENFGFRLYDPADPGRQIFFYGNMSPFLKSVDGKQAWASYIAGGGFAQSQVYADAPVLSPATTEQFFYTFNEFAALANNYGINHSFPYFSDLEIVESMTRNSPAASISEDDSIVRGLFTQNGVPYEGLFAASVVDAMSSYMYNVDAGYYTVYLVTGITAPADEFYLYEDILAQSLASFQFAESYVQNGVNQNGWETNAALQIAQTLSEAYDSYNQAWSNRQVVNDVLSQKRSDATLSYDRLYDTVTGDVYRAEVGFFDEYDIHREEYANPNLQMVPEDGYELYNKAISAYIYK